MMIFLKLLLAHIITDFYLQPDEWVEDKKVKREKSKYLYWHVILTGVVAALLLWDYTLWWVILAIVVSHYLIDLWKLRMATDGLKDFLIDQAMHILVIAFLASYVSGMNISEAMAPLWTVKNMAVLIGYAFITLPTGYIIGIATQRWRHEVTEPGGDRDSLAKAGIWIGVMERILVFTFVLIGQPQAIGFLIAAKSILRFSDKDEKNPRKQTEYVLIGTLISFSVALVTAMIVQRVI